MPVLEKEPERPHDNTNTIAKSQNRCAFSKGAFRGAWRVKEISFLLMEKRHPSRVMLTNPINKNGKTFFRWITRFIHQLLKLHSFPINLQSSIAQRKLTIPIKVINATAFGLWKREI